MTRMPAEPFEPLSPLGLLYLLSGEIDIMLEESAGDRVVRLRRR